MYRNGRKLAQIPSGLYSQNMRALVMHTPAAQHSATSFVTTGGGNLPVSYTGDTEVDRAIDETREAGTEQAMGATKLLLIGGVALGVVYLLGARRRA